MLNRREFLAVSAVAAAAPARKPNIIWIMADDLGYADVGCYGQKIIQTPNIDRLAREGTRFTDAYAGCTVCAPSRSVLMTGKHMGHTSVRSNPGGVPLLASDVTVAQILKKAGYACGCFGKWGLGDIGTDGVPWKHGFNEFFGYLHQAHAHRQYPKFLYDDDRQFPMQGQYAPDVAANRAVEFVKKNRAKPFFLYAAFTLPHAEYRAPEEMMKLYRGKFEEVGPYRGGNHLQPQPEPRTAYAAMVTDLDRQVGQLLDTLKQQGLERETLVVFTSDNGGATRLAKVNDIFSSYGVFRGSKQTMYEGGLRVPMIARWPGRVPAGRTSDFVWMFEDFLPTAAEVAGVAPPSDIDGMSVLPALEGKPQKPHDWLYWELPRYEAATGEFRKETPMQALRMGYWKAVRPVPDGPLELYDLKIDPAESRDISVQRPDIVRQVEQILAEARTEPRPQKEPAHDWWNPNA